jgi:hypothetical protein
LHAEFKDQHIKVLLDAKSYIEIDDGHMGEMDAPSISVDHSMRC